MKTSLTTLALALAALAVQAQPAAHASPDPGAQPAPPAPPAMPAVVPPVPPTPPVHDAVDLIAESGVAMHILSAERLVKGAPYCAQAVHETVQPLADGNRIVHQQTSQLCRDGEGRTRQEVERQGRKMVYLRDAVSGENWLLDPERKTARYLGGGRADADAQREYGERMREYQDKMRDYNDKMREYGRKMRDWARENFGHGETAQRAEAPKPPAPPAAPAAVRIATPVVISPGEGGQQTRVIRVETPLGPLAPMPPLPAAVAMRIEPLILTGQDEQLNNLPPKEIDGLKVTGGRATRTIPAGKIGNEKPIVISREVWTSSDLKVTVSVQTKDPRSGEQNYQLRNIRRAEPEAALMRVPADFAKTGLPKPRTPKDGKESKESKESKEG
ncbi:hypothetical protein [Mitsuaria sp. 7]|uniref:hypothetical protein n=1 Tax=Mitsuaria sp. 7 TaxID=1658665 RepID=UPI0007DDB1CF|nr:hypothetical protein [Mitsuaria sp. 7]ANH69791.1 hypothetical protein ABE85_23400 [Mitsuaria sp. 7]